MKKVDMFTSMTTEPIPKLMVKLSVPTIISMLVTSFYNMVDSFFIGMLDDTAATAAVGVAFSLMSVIQATGFFFGQGSGNYISRVLGAKKEEEAKTMASSGFFWSMIFGVVIAVLGLAFRRPLAFLLGATDSCIDHTVSYMTYILIGAPIMTSSLVLNNQTRFQGNAFYAMIGIVSGAVVNIALDPLFMFVLDMGVGGAALATIISQFISFVLLFVGSERSGGIKIRPKCFSPSLVYLKEIFRGGFPSLCRQGLSSVSVICLNNVAGDLGHDAAIAAFGIVSRIMMFANSAMIGFGQGFQPICGYNYGAKKYSRVIEAFWFSVKVSAVFLVVAASVMFVFSPELVLLFRKGDPAVTEIGSYALRVQCIGMPLYSIIIIVNMMLQSAGKAVSASIVAAARQGVFLIPSIFVLSALFSMSGLQFAQTTSDFLSFALALPLGLAFLNEMKTEMKKNEAD